MRGDSVRDLYAKTFAVCGLGLLACAGALVDYWPVRGEMPSVARIASLQPAIRVMAADLTRTIPPPPPARRVGARPLPASLPISTDAHGVFLFADAAVPLDGVAALGDPPAPAHEPLPVMADLPLPVTEMAPIGLMPAPWSTGGTESTSFLSDAVRRTRESIKEARASLRGALRGMVGAIKRVPFFTAAPVSTARAL